MTSKNQTEIFGRKRAPFNLGSILSFRPSRFKTVPVVFSLLVSSIPLWSQVNRPEVVEGEFIVRYKDNATASDKRSFFLKGKGRGILKGKTMRSLRTAHFKIDSRQDVESVLEELRQDPTVEFVEPNYKIYLTASPPTGDGNSDARAMGSTQTVSSYGMIDAMAVTGSYRQTATPVFLDDAWDSLSVASTLVPVVAVIDTGVAYNHPVFTASNAIWSNPGEIASNGIDDDQNGYVDDIRGWNFRAGTNSPLDDESHGTHVAGIVLGATMDILATSLPTAKIKIMPLKFLGSDGSGDTAGAINAIDYAIENGAHVINASWGGTSYSKSLHEAMARAYEAGLFVAAAAGNDGLNNDSRPIYPANLNVPGLVSVGAVDDIDNVAIFSNYGPFTVNLGAPGVDVESTIPSASGAYFQKMSGTSMAAPFISGLSALLLREAPQMSGYQIKQILLSSIDTRSWMTNKFTTKGRINAMKAITTVKEQAAEVGFKPGYTVVVPVRALASESKSSSSSGGGCGTLALLHQGQDQNGSSGPSGAVPVMIMVFIPLLVAIILRLLARRGRENVHSVSMAFDQRFSDRIQVNEVVAIRIGEREFKAKLRNLSSGGVAFDTEDALPSGLNEAVLRFRDSSSGEFLEVQARIMWRNADHQAGVCFQGLDDWAREFLFRLLTKGDGVLSMS